MTLRLLSDTLASERLSGVRLARRITGYLRLRREPQTPRQVAAWLGVSRETAEDLLCVMADARLIEAAWNETGTRVVFWPGAKGGA